MNILLVYPYTLKEGKPLRFRKAFMPPLNLAILDRLTPDRCRVTVVNELAEKIDFSKDYDLVGITAMTAQAPRAYQIGDRFIKLGVKTILGGIHPTALPNQAKEHSDAVVIGEAENLWPQIIKDCQENRLKDFYQDKSRPSPEAFVTPKWDSMNIKIYPKYSKDKYPILPIFTTRGCPLGCKFCSVTKFFGKSYRVKPVSEVIKEIDSTDAKNYYFVDDNIAFRYSYSRELFKALAKKDINWTGQISSMILKNPDLIDMAGKAGCSLFLIGFESINNKSLQAVNKGFNKVEQYYELIERIHKAGIIVSGSFIFGFDQDTLDQIKETIEFVKKNQLEIVSFWILTPPPGTELFKELKSQGRIHDLDWSKYDGSNVVFKPKNFTSTQLFELILEARKELYSIMRGIKVPKTKNRRIFRMFRDYSLTAVL